MQTEDPFEVLLVYGQFAIPFNCDKLTLTIDQKRWRLVDHSVQFNQHV